MLFPWRWISQGYLQPVCQNQELLFLGYCFLDCSVSFPTYLDLGWVLFLSLNSLVNFNNCKYSPDLFPGCPLVAQSQSVHMKIKLLTLHLSQPFFLDFLTSVTFTRHWNLSSPDSRFSLSLKSVPLFFISGSNTLSHASISPVIALSSGTLFFPNFNSHFSKTKVWLCLF